MMIDHESESLTKYSEEKNGNTQLKSLKKTLTNSEILSQACLFLFAGSETTATTMTFVAYLLAMNPEIQTRVYKEIEKAYKEKVCNFILSNQTKSKFALIE